MKTTLWRWVRAFGQFWWDFVIGDTPEFALATLVIIGAALLLRHQSWAPALLLPLLAAVFLLAGTLRGRRRHPAAPDGAAEPDG